MSRYNLTSQSHGDHGTLISNWVEERALLQTTGVTRYDPVHHEGVLPSNTHTRIISHIATTDYTQPQSRLDYQRPDAKDYSEKIFHLAQWNDATRAQRYIQCGMPPVKENEFESTYGRSYKAVPHTAGNSSVSSFFPTLYQSNPSTAARPRTARTPESFMKHEHSD